MATRWSNFTKEELEQIVKESYSFRDVAKRVGYAPEGGSGQKAVKEMINYYQFDISHFTGQGWNKNNFDYTRFKYGNNIRASNMLEAIVYLRGHQCEKCKLQTWLEQPITLEVHHKDGDHLNNNLSNLELLCPNCHSQTKTWRGKNINQKERVQVSEEQLLEALQTSPSIRQALLKVGLTAAGGNYTTAYKVIIKYNLTQFMKNKG